jgi:hypothetical protein
MVNVMVIPPSVVAPVVPVAEDVEVGVEVGVEDPHEIREHQIYAIVNNGRFNLSRPGNQGRYTRCHHFRTMEDWDSIFSYLTGFPTIIYDTADYIYYIRFLREYETMRHEAFPQVVLIPLPQVSPHFRRVVLHVECYNTQRNCLMGQFIPLLVSYHENHPIAAAITRLFYVETPHAPIYQTNESLVLLTFYQPFSDAANPNFPHLNHMHVERMCRYLIQPGNDFAAFDAMQVDASTFILPDPALLARARREIIVPDYNDDPIGARQANERWLDVVYPDRFPTEQQRREMYITYAADQINMHRRARITWARDFPYLPNPYELPRLGVEMGMERENNPADRVERGRAVEMNEFIQQLWDGQNGEDRARILLMMENTMANEHVIPVAAAEAEAAVAEPVFVHT